MATKKKITSFILNADVRTLFGKHVRKLRKEGIVPSNIFGSGFESAAIQLNSHDFSRMFREAGETQVITVHVEKNEYPCLVTHVQFHPVTHELLHVDLRKVDLKKKIEAHVPVELIGESEAVEMKIGDLLTITDSILVEALPNDMPQQIEVDLTSLKEIDSEIKVSDLKPVGNYEIKDDPEKVIVRVAEHKEQSLEADTTSEVAEGTEEAADAEAGETAEGETAEAPEEKTTE